MVPIQVMQTRFPGQGLGVPLPDIPPLHSGKEGVHAMRTIFI